MNIILKSVLATDSVIFFTAAIQVTFIHYDLKVIRFLLCSKKGFFMSSCRPN